MYKNYSFLNENSLNFSKYYKIEQFMDSSSESTTNVDSTVQSTSETNVENTTQNETTNNTDNSIASETNVNSNTQIDSSMETTNVNLHLLA